MSICELRIFIDEIYLSKNNNNVDLNEMYILYKQWKEKISDDTNKKLMIENLKAMGYNIIENQNEIYINNIDIKTNKHIDKNYLLSILNKQEQMINYIAEEIETMKNHIIYINMKITAICNTF